MVHEHMIDDRWVLGIETSCDETGVAIYHGQRGLLAHAVHSQVELHAAYGGVVPEIASRDHTRRILPLIRLVMTQADVTAHNVGGVAYTAGPGLIGALLVGAAVGRSLAYAWDIPALAVHHMEGHLLAPLLEPDPPTFPFLALLVSGGHTLLMDVAGVGHYRILGESLDDAVGEAFDKTAKLLGLGYPGGPALAALATQGNPMRFHFPRPMTDRPSLDFSFSGLKTCAITTLRRAGDDRLQTRADIAHAFQEAVVDTLAIKCRRALHQTGHQRLVVAGGVGANQALRISLAAVAAQAGASIHYPRLEFCTDNGAMIAFTGWLRLRAGCREPLMINAVARWSLETLLALP